EYNKKFLARRLNPRKGHEFMPYIVLIIDELADMMIEYIESKKQEISTTDYIFQAVIYEGGVDAIPYFLPLLKSDNSHILDVTCYNLGILKDPAIIEPIAPLLSHEDDQVVVYALMAIWGVRDISAMPLFVSLLSHESETIVRFSISALGSLDHPDILPYIIPFLANDDIETFEPAFHSVGRMSEEQLRNPMSNFLKTLSISQKATLRERLQSANDGLAERILAVWDELDNEKGEIEA
ncbi:MAG: HEAT repeat domain-containing protein, partial [Chloroflexota bacterium]